MGGRPPFIFVDDVPMARRSVVAAAAYELPSVSRTRIATGFVVVESCRAADVDWPVISSRRTFTEPLLSSPKTVCDVVEPAAVDDRSRTDLDDPAAATADPSTHRCDLSDAVRLRATSTAGGESTPFGPDDRRPVVTSLRSEFFADDDDAARRDLLSKSSPSPIFGLMHDLQFPMAQRYASTSFS